MMPPFFHGWRRKAGCVLLVMATVFMGGWIRSHVANDELFLGKCRGIHSFSLYSGRNGITLQSRTAAETKALNPAWHSWPLDPGDSTYLAQHSFHVEWAWHWCGFNAGESHDYEMPGWRMAWWTIPYWSIVCPLAILSAYLILRPGNRKPKSPTPA